MNQRIERIAVVIPAHDEEELLPGCLDSVAEAARWAGVPVSVIVSLDSCTDASARVVAGKASVRSVRCAVRNVGAARAIGVRAALGSGTRGLWLATTDADSVVPAALCAAAGMDMTANVTAAAAPAIWGTVAAACLRLLM